MVELEIQYFMGCPHAEEALMLLSKYKAKNANAEIKIVKVDNEDQAREIGFRGSPTILVNGIDLYEAPVPEEPRMACRFYPDGLPTVDELDDIISKRLISEKRKHKKNTEKM